MGTSSIPTSHIHPTLPSKKGRNSRVLCSVFAPVAGSGEFAGSIHAIRLFEVDGEFPSSEFTDIYTSYIDGMMKSKIVVLPCDKERQVGDDVGFDFRVLPLPDFKDTVSEERFCVQPNGSVGDYNGGRAPFTKEFFLLVRVDDMKMYQKALLLDNYSFFNYATLLWSSGQKASAIAELNNITHLSFIRAKIMENYPAASDISSLA